MHRNSEFSHERCMVDLSRATFKLPEGISSTYCVYNITIVCVYDPYYPSTVHRSGYSKLQQPHCDLIIDDGFYGEMIPFCGRTIQGQ